MPDYGDDRGFGRDVPQRVVRPNTGFDRAGPAIPDRANMRDVAQGPGGFDPNLRRAGYENLINQNRNMDLAAAGAGAGAAVGFGLGTKQPHTKAYEALWGVANRNVNPGGRTPLSVVQKEWNRLKQLYDRKVAGGGAGGTIGQKLGRLGKLAGRFGKGIPILGAFGLGQDWLDIMGGSNEFDEGTYDPGAQLSLRRGGIASLIRRL